jgi:hypothetical protein
MKDSENENLPPVDEVVNIEVGRFCQSVSDLLLEFDKRLAALESRMVKVELELDSARDCVGCIDALSRDTRIVKEKLTQLLALRKLPPNPPVN